MTDATKVTIAVRKAEKEFDTWWAIGGSAAYTKLLALTLGGVKSREEFRSAMQQIFVDGFVAAELRKP